MSPPNSFWCVQARQHVVSTSGAIFGLPDDTAIARTIWHGGSNHSLWFNYGNERNRRWSGEPLQARYGFGAHYPAVLAAGVTMALKVATCEPVSSGLGRLHQTGCCHSRIVRR